MEALSCDASSLFFLPVGGFDSRVVYHKACCVVSTEICSTLGFGNSHHCSGLSAAECCSTGTGIKMAVVVF